MKTEGKQKRKPKKQKEEIGEIPFEDAVRRLLQTPPKKMKTKKQKA